MKKLVPIIGIDIDDTIAIWPDGEVTVPIPMPADHAVEVLCRWVAEEVASPVYITSRTIQRREESLAWLQLHGFPCRETILCAEDLPINGKLGALQSVGGFAMVDDRSDNLEAAAAAGLWGFWRDIPKNRDLAPPVPHPRIVPWHDWEALDRLVRSRLWVKPVV